MGERKTNYHSKKRIFLGNQYTKKVKYNNYIIINFLIQQELIKTVNGSCAECSSKEISVKNIVDKKKGWSNKINISCCECGWTKYIYTSKEVNIPGQSGQKSHELNVRSVMAFREFGKGFESMETFSRIMNMTKPINIKAYNAINDHLLEAYLVAADNSMSQAAIKFKEISEKHSSPEEDSLHSFH